MENSIDILNELKELSPTLAAIEKLNVFSVPEGYFEYLGADILMRVEKENGLTNNTTADIPAGYFDGLATSILGKIKAQENEDAVTEMSSLSPELLSIQHVNAFEVPHGYFDTLADSVLAKIKTATVEDAETEISTLSPMLYGIQNKNVFEVPQDYFDMLADSVLAKTKAGTEDAASEIRALSPMLYSIQNENVFEVPRGYFENLPETVLDKLKPQAKVVTMQKRSSVFIKYAVAAAFTGVMALGVFKFTGNGNKKTELPDYVTAGLKVQDVDQELAKISDEDIVKFLEASGTDVKAAVVANSVDQHELPAQEDYLLDEKALDKYLNSINIDDLKN